MVWPAVVGGAIVAGASLLQGQQNAAAQERANQTQAGMNKAQLRENARQFDVDTGIGENRYAYESGLQNELAQSRRDRFDTMRGQNLEAFSPYTSAGSKAQEAQMAMMGLGTPEQQAKYKNLMNESPGMRFLRERQEKTLLRNQAAQGKLGSGGAKRELAELGFNLAQTDLDNMYARLGGIADRGVTSTQYGLNANTGPDVGVGTTPYTKYELPTTKDEPTTAGPVVLPTTAGWPSPGDVLGGDYYIGDSSGDLGGGMFGFDGGIGEIGAFEMSGIEFGGGMGMEGF